MAANWFYQNAGETIGPVSSSKLKALALEGTIRSDTRIRKGELGKWIGAQRVEGLIDKPAVDESDVMGWLGEATPKVSEPSRPIVSEPTPPRETTPKVSEPPRPIVFKPPPPPVSEQPPAQNPDKPLTEYKTCPFCGERILAVAKKCKHCGEFLVKDMRRESQTVRSETDVFAILTFATGALGIWPLCFIFSLVSQNRMKNNPNLKGKWFLRFGGLFGAFWVWFTMRQLGIW